MELVRELEGAVAAVQELAEKKQRHRNLVKRGYLMGQQDLAQRKKYRVPSRQGLLRLDNAVGREETI